MKIWILSLLILGCSAEQFKANEFKRFTIDSLISDGYVYEIVCDKKTGAEYIFLRQSGAVKTAVADCRVSK